MLAVRVWLCLLPLFSTGPAKDRWDVVLHASGSREPGSSVAPGARAASMP